MRIPLVAKSVLTVGLLIAFSLALVGFYLDRREREAVTDQVLARLEAQATLLAPEVASEAPDGDAWAQLAKARTHARVTVIAADGRVLADSDEASARMENHSDRPEVAAALAGGSGLSRRFSHTISLDLVYFATRVLRPSGRQVVLRLSVPLHEVSHGFLRFRLDFLGIAALSLAVACAIAVLWARSLVRPLRQMIAFSREVSRGHVGLQLDRRPADEIGDLAGALTDMARDLQVTLRRLAEEGQRIRTIMQSMAEGVLVLDGRGRISLVNPAAETLLGLTGRSVLGAKPLEAVRSHELDDLLKAAGEVSEVVRAEISLDHPRRRIVAGTAVAMRDADGAIQGTVLALRDVTQLKHLEEVRIEFVLNVSHELRTPLTAIRGYAETLLDSSLKDPDEARRFLEIIHRHAERLGRLLNDLLDLSNIELDQTTFNIRPLSLGEVARHAAAGLAPQAEQKSLSLETLVPDDLPFVLADRDRLVQILVNLLDNAVKYTPEGGRITVTARRVDGPPGETAQPGTEASSGVEVAVADTGIGIPPKDLPRITERFYRVDKARSRELGGTGLGLALVKHLVQAQGGRLTIESHLGEGTAVRVLLPAAPAPETA